jgi:hypothetical protein
MVFAMFGWVSHNVLSALHMNRLQLAGTLKKGKAARQAQELLMRGAEVQQRERDLMKAVPEPDMINAMVGTVKLSMPGLAKLAAVDRAAKKNAKKQAAAGRGSGKDA